jgi:hypothetical protein
LQAASEAGDYHLALADMRPLMSGMDWQNFINAERQFGEGNPYPALREENSPRLFANLTPRETAEIARELATAYEKTGSQSEALPYLQRAYRLEADTKLKSQLNREVQQIQAALRRSAINQTRRPVIHSALEQENLVRPRLPEQTRAIQAGPKDHVRKGGDQ